MCQFHSLLNNLMHFRQLDTIRYNVSHFFHIACEKTQNATNSVSDNDFAKPNQHTLVFIDFKLFNNIKTHLNILS